MADLKLTAPARGENVIVNLEGKYEALELGFSLENVFFERIDNDLILSFDALGSKIVLQDFYTVYTTDNLPEVVSQNGAITLGETFLANLGPQFVIQKEEQNVKQSRRNENDAPEQIASLPDDFVQQSLADDGIDLGFFTARVNVQIVEGVAVAGLSTPVAPAPGISPTIPQANIELGLGADAFIMPSQVGSALSRSNLYMPLTGKLSLQNIDANDFTIYLTIQDLGTYEINESNYNKSTGEFTIDILKTDLAGLSLKNPTFTFSIENGGVVSAPSNPLHLVQNYTEVTQVGETFIANEVEDGKTYNGNAGNDRFALGKLSNSTTLNSAEGNDVIAVDVLDTSTIIAGAGSDSISISYAKDASIDAGSGNDTIQIIAPAGTVDPNAGVFSGSISAGTGNDSVEVGTNLGTIYGDSNNQSVVGGNDIIKVGVSSGTIYGDVASSQHNMGDDVISVNELSGTIYADTNTYISGEFGDDKIVVGTMGANSSIYTDSATNSALGGNDTVQISRFDGANIKIDAGAGNDTFIYNNSTYNEFELNDDGKISITGLDSSIEIIGFENITAGSGNDTITGNSFANILRGGAGDDELYGGLGDDILFGGRGDDFMDGGAGADIYRWSDNDVIHNAHDTINVDGDDSLDLASFREAGFEMSITGGGTSPVVLELTAEIDSTSYKHTITLQGVSDYDSFKDQYEANNGIINI